MGDFLGALTALYRTEMFMLFPLVTTAVATLSLVAFAAPLTAIAVADPPALRKYRIQRKKPRAQDLIRPSIKSWAVNNVVMGTIVVNVVLNMPYSPLQCGSSLLDGLQAYYDYDGPVETFSADDPNYYGYDSDAAYDFSKQGSGPSGNSTAKL